MTAFLKLFHGGVKAAVVVEDIFLAIGALVNGMFVMIMLINVFRH